MRLVLWSFRTVLAQKHSQRLWTTCSTHWMRNTRKKASEEALQRSRQVICIVRFPPNYQDQSLCFHISKSHNCHITGHQGLPEHIERDGAKPPSEKHDPLCLTTDDGIPVCNTAVYAGHLWRASCSRRYTVCADSKAQPRSLEVISATWHWYFIQLWKMHSLIPAAWVVFITLPSYFRNLSFAAVFWHRPLLQRGRRSPQHHPVQPYIQTSVTIHATEDCYQGQLHWSMRLRPSFIPGQPGLEGKSSSWTQDHHWVETAQEASVYHVFWYARLAPTAAFRTW